MATTLTKRKSPSQKRAPKPTGWNLRRAGGLQILEAPAFTALDWLVHGFSTRPGGASELAASDGARKNNTDRVLNLGFTDWDSRACVLENRKKFFHAIGADKLRAVTLRQIHSDAAHRADAAAGATHVNANEKVPQGDALFTRDPGILLAVQTADCIPILLADTKRHAIAAIHAGWRGTLSRIAAKTLGRMQMEFGTRPEDVVAALGPGIGRCCYEVGSEVARDFDAQFPNAREWFDGPFDALASGENDPNWLPWLTMKPPGHQPPPLRVHLDLIAANHAILTDAGIPAGNISASGFCTACRTDLLFSYRRERTTGRMMAAVGIV
jgi:YfiH family protein